MTQWTEIQTTSKPRTVLQVSQISVYCDIYSLILLTLDRYWDRLVNVVCIRVLPKIKYLE